MRPTGFLLVAIAFVSTALVTHVVVANVAPKHDTLVLVVAAIVGTQVGTIVWHRQAPTTTEGRAKLGLGVALAVTALTFSLVFHAASDWPATPEVTIPLGVIGCGLFPFVLVTPLWKALSKSRSPTSEGD